MTDLRKAAERLVAAVENDDNIMMAMDELRQALAQPEQEPVAWMNKKSAFMCGKTDESGVAFHIITTSKQTKHHTVPLYTAPPKREWIGLEDEDVATVNNEFNRGALWAEKILKEKNT